MAYLLKEPKKGAAATLRSTFERDPVLGAKLINELCDVIMEPTHLLPIGQGEELGDWIKAILGGTGTFEDFCAAFRVYDNSPFCGCVWTANFVAYRCKTCATSPCMSICAACFERGNHEGHEYNIFRSEAGGACDCGDPSVMSEAGFCSQHGVNRAIADKVPDSLFAIPKIMIERMLLLLLHTLRFLCKDLILESTFPSKIPDPVAQTVDIFIEVIKLGTPIRTFVSKLLMDEQYYSRLNSNLHYGGIVSEDMKRFHENCHIWFPEASKRLPISEPPEEIQNKERFGRQSFKYKTILQELMFWTVRYEFPETLILFLLNMLPNAECKQAFARTFARHYIYIAPSLNSALRVEELSNRIVHISVQLFSNSDLAYLLAKEEGLLEIFVISLHSIVSSKLIESQTSESDFHQCIAIAGTGLQSNSYWAIVSDLVNCLGHNEVALLFLNNDDVMRTWMRILLCYSGMNLASRELNKHVEYDPREILLAFYSEREACAAPLWVLLDALRDASTLPLARKAINLCLETLVELLDALGVDDVKATALPFDKISFHYPVHRYFALFIANAISRQGMGIKDLRRDLEESWARKIMAHSLQVLCTIQEIQSNMWVRNGSNIQTQELAYKQSFFCTFFIDADLFLLQLCSCYMTPDIFVSSVFERCRVSNCLTVNRETTMLPPGSHGFVGQPQDEKLVQMLESAFSILLSAVGISTHLGISDKKIIENEVVSILSVQSYTHSGISDRIPQCHDMHAGEKSRFFSEPLSEIIERLAVTVEGDAMAQTKYSLKEQAWKLYDPLFTAHRAMYRKNVQQAHTNYFKHLQKMNILDSGALESSVWPPFQRIKITDERYVCLNKILNCRTLHTAIFMILYKYLNEHPVVTEKTLVYALNLIDAGLTASPSNHEKDESKEERKVQDAHDSNWKEMLDMWFTSDYMAINIRQVIDNIQIPLPPSLAETTLHQSEAMEVDENEGESSRACQSKVSDDAEQCIVIQESIITMLLKLHGKMTKQKNSFAFPEDFIPNLDPPHPVPVTGPAFIRKILLFAASKSPETEKIIKQLCGTRKQSDVELSTGAVIDVEKERRREKAKEMQDKLLKEFAKKQKKFLESAEIEMNLPDGSSEDNNEMNVDKEDGDQLDCVICGVKEDRTLKQTGSNSIEQTTAAASKVIGLICFAQPSSLLGFRTDSETRRPIMMPGIVPKKFETCRSLNQLTCANLKEKFPAEFTSCSIGNNAGWELCPHVSTCGHHIHISCYREYMQWVQRDETGYLRFEGGLGFQCPLCRQTSNIVIPCNIGDRVDTDQSKDAKIPSDSGASSGLQEYEKSLSSIQKTLVSNIPVRTLLIPVALDPAEGTETEDRSLQEVSILSVDEVLKICLRTHNDIVTQSRTGPMEIPSEMDSRGNFRSQLEYDLHQLGGSLFKDVGPPGTSLLSRKLVIGPMFHLMSKYLRVTGDAPNNEFANKLWSQLTSIIKLDSSDKSCPLLIKDPIALLIELCIAMYPPTLEQYQHLVQVIYNLVLVQALVQISCKFSFEERRAWMSNCSVSLGGVPFTAESLDCILGHVISCMPKSLYDENARADQSRPSQCFTSTVWSPQSVQSAIEDLLLHFLRITALLQFHVFHNMRNDSSFPLAESAGNEFSYLTDYLRLGSGSVTSHSSSTATSTCIITARWPCTPRTLISQWCKEAESFIVSDHKVAFQLLNRHRAWKQPKLVELPENYTTLFSKFRDVPCPSCKGIPKEPAICLMCGQFVCYKGMCQRPRDVYDEETKSVHRVESQGATTHSKLCGNGTVALLLINSTLTTVIRGPRSCMWGTLYLDHHGEEDRGWKRGRLLTLKHERLHLLTRQWINHIFDNVSKGWSMHRNQL